MSKFIIQVAPVIPLPVLRTQVFSYWHDEDLPAGTLVSVPFYFREIQGIVIGSRRNHFEHGAMKLKKIKSVIEKKFLSANQIDLAKKIADYYFSPLGSVLKLMVPKKVKLNKKKKSLDGANVGIEPNSWKFKEYSSRIFKSRKRKFLLTGSAGEREKVDTDLIREYLKYEKQCLILIPEIFFSQGVYEKLQKEFSEEIALINSRISRGQLYDCWKKIKNNKIKIVVASKIGIFLPFYDLGLIIVREEQDVSFKQSRAMPRYNAVRGAEFLADTAEAKLILESSVPSVENLYRAKKGQLEMITIDRGKDDFPDFEVISPESEKKNPDFPISKVLYDHLALIFKKKKQAVVFVNRRGFSTRTICENCKNLLRCPKCELALIYSEEKELYRCLRCAYKIDLFTACPNCGGFQFSHRGIGTQTVERKIKKLFPFVRPARVDADTMRNSIKNQKILQKFADGEFDVLIGTQSAIKGIYSKNIELVAAISGRDFADGSEFNSREQAFSNLFHMANLLRQKGRILIQSYLPENPLFVMLGYQNLKKYYQREIEIRKRFSYPPFCKFVKLSYQGKLKEMKNNEAIRTFDLLMSTSDNNIVITGPFEPPFGLNKALYKRNILIRTDPKSDIRKMAIRSVIGGLRKGWSVDIDPVSLL